MRYSVDPTYIDNEAHLNDPEGSSSREVPVRIFVISLAVVAVFAFLMGWFFHKSVPENATPAPSVPAVVQAPAWKSPVTKISGSTERTSAYRCESDLVPVQVPVGQTVEQNGATFKLDQTTRDAGYENRQVTAVFTVQLAANTAAPAYIVNTGAHNKRPDLYGQSVIEANVGMGGNASHTLTTEAYTSNYFEAGITDITVCLRVG